MTPLKIGACLKTPELKDHRDWLFDAARDIELQVRLHDPSCTDL